MHILQAIVLGIIQGLTEFLPVSSSGHLVLAQHLLGVQEPSLSMSILLHLGTLSAVMIVFWRDWLAMLRHPFKSHVFWMLVLATLPAVFSSLLLTDLIEQQSGKYSSGLILGICFLFTALLLLLAEAWSSRRRVTGRHAKRPPPQDVADITPKQALGMGVMQGIAVLPGISRSGSTMVGGLFCGLNRTTAAKFSFMMSAPAIVGSVVFDLKDLVSGDSPVFADGWIAPVLGILVAGVVGYLAIRWMLRLLERVSLRVFALYVGIVGALVLLDSTVFHLFF